jgi:hypothetical protein
LLGLADLARYVYVLSERDWLRRPQLIDGRQACLAMPLDDVRVFSELMAILRQRSGRGPIAFVPGNDTNECVAALYHDLGGGANPEFATFPDMTAAEAWLSLRSGHDGDAGAGPE